jgi:2-oxoglutarate ferredoxin oxidoreductase subunit alpha
VPAPVVLDAPGAEIGVIGYGTSHWAIDESLAQLEREAGLAVSYLRLRAYPFNGDLGAFIDRCARVYVVEQNRDAQMLSLMRLELGAERIAKLRSVLHFNGLPIDARSVTDDILIQEGRKARADAHADVVSAGLHAGGE